MQTIRHGEDYDNRLNNRCASVDAQFVKRYGLTPKNGVPRNGKRMIRKQISCGPQYREPPAMKNSISFSYFTPPSSPDSLALTSSEGNSPNSTLSYSSIDNTYHQYGYQQTRNGQHDDDSSISESTVDSYVTSEDFDNLDMRLQWLEWEALSKNVGSDDDFLDQETLV